MKKKGGRILWLVYIDASVPRSRGRVLPRGLAVEKPSLKEVVQALEELGYKFQVFPDKKYPPLWFEEKWGYVVVETNEKIREIASKVAGKIREMRK
ncbi:signal recognition particle subunit SRP19/SEC65 family protein [Pyrobaculum aerophilum]|uniref:Signal recognition particle 19 kDa protein n=1 Tax=Pyrobaculum aerophilum TaxID=13773 RepID=A0A371R466_9CREN|nr:signal recognition particle subunit SRP19/SEC65 family protein [Pyrobaculum aerophilum]RFA98557.1 signal recognition particle [Pyrobaculum aerophilum]RFA99262.1 signal recognition particle [Pyrobaculum aerophilum]